MKWSLKTWSALGAICIVSVAAATPLLTGVTRNSGNKVWVAWMENAESLVSNTGNPNDATAALADEAPNWWYSSFASLLTDPDEETSEQSTVSINWDLSGGLTLQEGLVAATAAWGMWPEDFPVNWQVGRKTYELSQANTPMSFTFKLDGPHSASLRNDSIPMIRIIFSASDGSYFDGRFIPLDDEDRWHGVGSYWFPGMPTASGFDDDNIESEYEFSHGWNSPYSGTFYLDNHRLYVSTYGYDNDEEGYLDLETISTFKIE